MSQRKMKSGLSMYLASRKPPPAKPPAKKGRVRKQRPPRPATKPVTFQTTSVRQRPTRPPAEGNFRAALIDPFSGRAFGARVCDSFMIPTATYHVRSTVTLNSSAGGKLMFAVLPSPCLSFLFATETGTAVGTQFGLTAFGQNPTAMYCCSPTTLSAQLTEYRTVACGFRFVAKDTATSTKGKVYVATVPTTENAPSWNTLETVTGSATAIGEYLLGMDFSQGTGLQIAGLPSVRTFSMQDLLRGTVAVNLPPTHDSFYMFKGTTDRSNVVWNTGQVLADEGVFNNTTGLVNATAGGRKDIASLRGGRAAVVLCTGLPASTNEIDIELIYHLEGTPNISSTQNAMVPSAMRISSGSTSLVETALKFASGVDKIVQYLKDPAVQTGATRALSFLGL